MEGVAAGFMLLEFYVDPSADSMAQIASRLISTGLICVRESRGGVGMALMRREQERNGADASPFRQRWAIGLW